MLTGFELEPFRDPRYWDGNVLGETPVESGEMGRRTSALCAFASEALTTKLRSMHTYWPEDRLKKNEQFNVNEHSPGTVVRFRRERIVRGIFAAVATEAAHEYTGYPTNELGHSSLDWWHTRDKQGFYTSSGFWGVVTPPAGRDADQNILAIPDNLTTQPRSTFAPAACFGRVIPRHTTIGEVYGLPRYGAGIRRKSRAYKNQFNRVTALDIVGLAGRRQPSKLESLAGRIGLGVQSPAIEGNT